MSRHPITLYQVHAIIDGNYPHHFSLKSAKTAAIDWNDSSPERVRVVSPELAHVYYVSGFFLVDVSKRMSRRVADSEISVKIFAGCLLRAKLEYPSLTAVSAVYFPGNPGFVDIENVIFGDEADAVLYSMWVYEKNRVFPDPPRAEDIC